MSYAVRLDNVGKRYVKYDDVPLLLTRLRFRAGNRREHLWAIRNVDLEVAEGETLGVIGRNGSGKSTMLRMLAGVTAPTEGTVSVRGRVAPLISVGVGFHPELTGRENVFVSGMILGTSRREMQRLFDSIVEFAELEDFIDTPVKFYSSGMFVRLGFSVAVASRPDVLLVDEVLAVGDLGFQTKCFERMEEIRAEGSSVIVVSHNLTLVRNLCARTLLLHNGDPLFLGKTDEAISHYTVALAAKVAEEGGTHGQQHLEILGLELIDSRGQPTAHIQAGDEVIFRFDVRFLEAAKDPYFGFHIATDAGVLVYKDATLEGPTGSFEAGQRVQCDIRIPARLTTGSYQAHARAHWYAGDEIHGRGRAISFFTSGRPRVQGATDLHGTFDITKVDETATGPATYAEPR